MSKTRTTPRLDWTIEFRGLWIATHTDGQQVVAQTRQALNSKINTVERDWATWDDHAATVTANRNHQPNFGVRG